MTTNRSSNRPPFTPTTASLTKSTAPSRRSWLRVLAALGLAATGFGATSTLVGAETPAFEPGGTFSPNPGTPDVDPPVDPEPAFPGGPGDLGVCDEGDGDEFGQDCTPDPTPPDHGGPGDFGICDEGDGDEFGQDCTPDPTPPDHGGPSDFGICDEEAGQDCTPDPETDPETPGPETPGPETPDPEGPGIDLPVPGNPDFTG